MASLFSFTFLLLIAGGRGVSDIDKWSGGFLQKLSAFVHRKANGDDFDERPTLWVCNAFPHKEKMHVWKDGMQITSKPLNYKDCSQHRTDLKAGDRIDFRANGNRVGQFSVFEVPEEDSVLFLVISKHGTNSSKAMFDSHVFAHLLNPQILVLDTYRGDAKEPTLRIRDFEDFDGQRSADLHWHSVVAVNSGRYHTHLVTDGKDDPSWPLHAKDRETYVLLRVGGEYKDGHYPSELVVFPNPGDDLKSGAIRCGFVLGLLLAILSSA